MLVVVMFLAWMTSNSLRGTLTIQWCPVYVPVVLLLAFGLLQYAAHLSPDQMAAREALFKLLTDLLLFFLVCQLFGDMSARAWRALGFTIAVYAALLGLVGIVQFLFSREKVYGVVPSPFYSFGPYINHNHYAGLMEMLIPTAGAFALTWRMSVSGRILLAFFTLLSVASFLLSGSRGGLISLVAEVALLLVVLLYKGDPRRVRRPVVILGVGLAAAVLFFRWISPAAVPERLATVGHVPKLTEVGAYDRLVVLRDSLRMFYDHPWLGTGLGSFETVYLGYQSFPDDRYWDHAHDDYAEGLVETGVPGAALILLALVLFFRLAFGNVYERLRSEVGRLQFGAALGCCGLLVHSFFDFNLRIPANAAWFAFCAALACGGSSSETIASSGM